MTPAEFEAEAHRAITSPGPVEYRVRWLVLAAGEMAAAEGERIAHPEYRPAFGNRGHARAKRTEGKPA